MYKKKEIDLGTKFGKLTLIKEVTQEGKRRRFLCLCDCGKEKEARYSHLFSGRILTCGCSKIERISGKGELSLNWKNGKRMISGGYIDIYLPDHPDSRANGYIKEHRLVMEKMIGRRLYKEENVHHKNGDRSDNRESNLELWNHSQPCGQRIEDKLQWANEILEKYKDYNICKK